VWLQVIAARGGFLFSTQRWHLFFGGRFFVGKLASQRL